VRNAELLVTLSTGSAFDIGAYEYVTGTVRTWPAAYLPLV